MIVDIMIVVIIIAASLHSETSENARCDVDAQTGLTALRADVEDPPPPRPEGGHPNTFPKPWFEWLMSAMAC